MPKTVEAHLESDVTFIRCKNLIITSEGTKDSIDVLLDTKPIPFSFSKIIIIIDKNAGKPLDVLISLKLNELKRYNKDDGFHVVTLRQKKKKSRKKKLIYEY